MGEGRAYICAKCGYDYDILLGRGGYSDLQESRRYLYYCEDCGTWSVEWEAAADNQELFEADPGVVDNCSEESKRACPQCGKAMNRYRSFDDFTLEKMKCPRCGTENEPISLIDWD